MPGLFRTNSGFYCAAQQQLERTSGRIQGGLFHLSCVGLMCTSSPLVVGDTRQLSPYLHTNTPAPIPCALNLLLQTAEEPQQLQAAIPVQKGMLNIRKLCKEDGAQHSVSAPGLALGAAGSRDSSRKGVLPLGANLL